SPSLLRRSGQVRAPEQEVRYLHQSKAGIRVPDQDPGVATEAASDETAAAPAATEPETDESGEPQFEEETEAVINDLEGSFADAIDATIVEFDDGSLVSGTVVKIDSDEVLLDIGYKSEGVIPTKELSIRNDVDPHEVVTIGEQVEALVLTKEDKDG